MLSSETVERLRGSVAKAVEALELAAGYVERGWTRGCLAVDEDGLAVAAGDPRACRWCMTGGMRAAFERLGVDGADARAVSVRSIALYAATVACTGRKPGQLDSWGCYLPSWNDSVAMSGEQVAGKLREAGGWVRLRIETVEDGIKRSSRATA